MSNRTIVKETAKLAKEVQSSLIGIISPPDEGTIPYANYVLPHSFVRNTRGYIEKVVHQINGCYERGWYDACAVMMRRLIETLIIEVFENHNIEHKIKNKDNDYLYLKDLIIQTLNESSWSLGRNTKKSLRQLKDIGDRSAHSRRYIAHRSDIDNQINNLRVASQELLFLANLK